MTVAAVETPAPVGVPLSQTAAALDELRQELAARGWNRKATGRILFELFVNMTLSLGGIAIFVLADNWLIRIAALLVSSAGSMGVGTNSHTSSHGGTSNKRWVNDFLTYFGYPFFLGLSATYWWYKHVAVHHPAPNVIGQDTDADLAPWFARTRDEIQKSTGFRRWYYEKIQWIVFPFALAANGFNFHWSGWAFVVGKLRQPGIPKGRYWIDIGAMTLHLVVNLLVPMIWFSPLAVIGFYAVRVALLGFGMFAILAPGHFPAEAACLSKTHGSTDYFLLQTATTINFRTGPIGRLICSGLEYQIEHHLFPHLSHPYYRKMSAIVQDLCRKHGLPYRSYQWDHVLWKSLTVFRTPPQIKDSLEPMRIQGSGGSPA